jgi:NADH-quinone oxidoreductase subunit C
MNSFERIKNELGEKARSWDEKNPRNLFVDVAAGDIPSACERLFNVVRLRFIIVSGTDTPRGFELLYHFSDDGHGTVITLRTLLSDRQNPQIASITPIITGASWIEREIHELLGVKFTGHPSLKHLLLAEDWPEGKYPLRNDHEK